MMPRYEALGTVAMTWAALRRRCICQGWGNMRTAQSAPSARIPRTEMHRLGTRASSHLRQ